MNILDRQTFIFSIYMFSLTGATNPSQIQTQLNLRFIADELVVKSISYSPYTNDPTDGSYDLPDNIQIWCNITNDNLIGVFTNSVSSSIQHDDHFTISNKFQSGNFTLQFQQTDEGAPFFYNPEPLISLQNAQRTFGTVSITIEFLKTR